MGVYVNIYKRKAFDPVGWFVCMEEGDADATHVTIEIDGIEYTTGARWGWKGPLYGAVDPDKYQDGRGMYICEFVNRITEVEKKILIESCQALDGMPYGFDTLLALTAARYRGGRIPMLGSTPKLTIDHPICSEAVVHHAWKIDRPLCVEQGKLEARACTPENVYTAALFESVLKIVHEIK